MKQQYYNADDFVVRQEEVSHKVKQWFARLLRSWRLFLLSVVVCLGLAFLYMRFASPVYEAVASVMVKDETKGPELVDDSKLKQVGLSGNSKLVVNEVEVLKSFDLMEDVVDTLQLFVSVENVRRFKDAAVYGYEIPFDLRILNPEVVAKPVSWTLTQTTDGILFKGEGEDKAVKVGYGQEHESRGIRFICQRREEFESVVRDPKEDISDNYSVVINPRHQTIIAYNRKLLVEQANKLGTVINLDFKDNSKVRAQAVLQMLLVIYSERNDETHRRITANTIDFLNDRLAEVSNELQTVERSVEKFKSQNKVTTLSADAEQYLAISQQVDADKAEKQTQLNIITALEADLQANKDNPKLVPTTYGIQDASLGQLIEKYNELVLRKESVQQRSGPKNPLLIDLQNQVSDLRGRLLANVRNLKQAYKISLDDISRKDAMMSTQIRKVPEMEKRLVQVTRIQNVQEQLYSFLLQKREEAAVSRASNLDDFQIVVNAREIGIVSPKANIVWTVAFLMSFIIPIAFLGFKDYVNNKVGDAMQVQQYTDVPLLGVIPHVKKVKSSIVIGTKSRSAVAEQLRNIRTSINYSGRGRDVKTIMITSFQPGDGKSFVSLNLAAGYALLGKKTIMLEFDLRRPHISKDMGLSGEEGIASILSGKNTLDELLVEVESHKGFLYVLPAGHLTINPAELIASPRMPWFFKSLKERFDYILINTPPISLVTDASLLEQYADMTLIVLRQDHTSRGVYNELKYHASKRSDKPVYIVLNDVGKKKFYESPYSYSEYGYSTAKGYYEED